MLAGVLKQAWGPLAVLALPLVLAAILQALRRSGKVALGAILLAAAAVATAMAIAVAVTAPPFKMEWVPRYPLAVSWLEAPLVAIAAKFTSQPNPPEAVFRIVPFLSAALLAWTCARKAEGLRAAARLLYMLAVASIPVVLYYSSVLYLEMPAVLLMTVVCLGAEIWTTCAPEELPGKPEWYALILLGFVKETVPAFLGAAILARLWVRLRYHRGAGSPRRQLLAEARPAACALIPFLVYWAYRTFLSTSIRGYSPDPAGLIDVGDYATVARALGEQFGAVGAAFLAGIVLAGRAMRSGKFALLLLATLSYAAMHLMDRQDVIGYSRYMLMFAPMLIAGMHEAVVWAAGSPLKKWHGHLAHASQGRLAPASHGRDARETHGRDGHATRSGLLHRVAGPASWGASAGLLGIVGASLLLCPVHLDGARQPGWGEYRQFWTEHSYPYREAIGYLMAKYPRDRTLSTGLDIEYWQEFYVGRSGLMFPLPTPRGGDESRAAEEMLVLAAGNGFQHVLYHVMGPSIPHPRSTSGFTVEKVFRNSSHELILFSAAPAGAPHG
jgi:hypothetical protein